MIPTVLGYLDGSAKHAGDTIALHVSVLNPLRQYRAQLVRLSDGPVDAGSNNHREEAIACAINGHHFGFEQVAACGSRGLIEGTPKFQSFEMQIDVWPGIARRCAQSLMACETAHLGLDAEGAGSPMIGDRRVSTGVPLILRHWHHLTAIYDASLGRARVTSSPHPGPLLVGDAVVEAAMSPSIVNSTVS